MSSSAPSTLSIQHHCPQLQTAIMQHHIFYIAGIGSPRHYYIVLYLYIYIALLAVHTNQKRFQLEIPKEKRAVLRERKEAFGSPVNKEERVKVGTWFKVQGQ